MKKFTQFTKIGISRNPNSVTGWAVTGRETTWWAKKPNGQRYKEVSRIVSYPTK